MGCAQSCQQSNRSLDGGGGGGGRSSSGRGGGAVQAEGDFGVRDGRNGGVGHQDKKRSAGSSSSSHRQQQTGGVQKPTTFGAACDSLDRRRGLERGEAGPPGADGGGEGWDAVSGDDGEESTGSDKQPMQVGCVCVAGCIFKN